MIRLSAHSWFFCAVVASGVLSLGCSRRADPRPAASLTPGSTEDDFQPGSPVVVESARASFFEAVVLRPGFNRLQIGVSDGSGTREVDRSSVYPIRTIHSAAALVDGSFGICRLSPKQWVGCRIERHDSESLVASDENGNLANVDPTSILKPSAITELNLRQAFDQAVRRKVFVEEVRSAGRPQSPKGWSVRPGERILVASGDGYASGKVTRIRKGQVTVQLDGQGKEGRIVDRSQVFAQPPVPFSLVSGAYACLRPSSGEQLWPVVRIESGNEGQATVSDVYGQRKTVEVHDLVPLSR